MSLYSVQVLCATSYFIKVYSTYLMALRRCKENKTFTYYILLVLINIDFICFKSILCIREHEFFCYVGSFIEIY